MVNTIMDNLDLTAAAPNPGTPIEKPQSLQNLGPSKAPKTIRALHNLPTTRKYRRSLEKFVNNALQAYIHSI
jgi:hypothetical protein